MAEQNNKNCILLVNELRSLLFDTYLILDELVEKITKHLIAQPAGKIEDDGVIDIDVIRSGEPEKRV